MSVSGLAPAPSATVENFLKQRGVNIIVSGSYTVPHWYDPQGKPRTFACRTSRVSPFRMMVEVPVVGKIGDRLSSYFPDLGKFDGCISDTAKGGFLLELEMTGSMREKFSNKLTWLEQKQKNPGIADIRKYARIIPASHIRPSRWPMAPFTVASSSICRLPVQQSPLSCSRRSGPRWPWEPASVAWSDFCPMALRSSSSKRKTVRTSIGFSCARHDNG